VRGEKATKPCAACGTELTRLVSQKRGKHWYCDNRCQAAHMPPPCTISKEQNPYRGQKDTRPCENCRAPVTRYLSALTLGRSWFCSKRCRMTAVVSDRMNNGRWTRPRKPRRGDTIACVICSVPIYRQPEAIERGRQFCSRACANESQRKSQIVKLCEQCGAEMRLRPSAAVRRYCSKSCDTAAKTKQPTGRLHNGRPVLMNRQGYLTVYEPGHPNANVQGRILEHRLVMSTALGRPLLSSEHIDHINQDRADNRPDNLQVMSPTDHSKKTSADQQRARAKLLADLAAYQEKYGPLME
jgi:endogenous inhibitor of DNA gyrase (YacG/DUF329 family)